MSKIAAIWTRVSDPKQEEPSLDRQVANVRAWLEEQGWQVPDDKVIKVVWTSKKILNCPQMQMLLKWVETGEVKAVGMTHLDRLSGRPGHMSQIFETFKEANCQLLAKETPLPTGLMGELVALVITLSKAMQVDKADNGAKDGLRDRVKRKRLPTSGHRLYGYRWATESQLEPDPEHPERYEGLKVMFDLALRGATYHAIQKELQKRVILSPTGNPQWDRSSIASIVNNPVYAGRYYALRHEACEPKTRRTVQEGNTSSRSVSLEQATYLPEVHVIDPPITWEQYLRLQERRRKNKELALRNAKRNYLLRGFILCETHRGKRGEPRKYYGEPQNKSFKYTCPVGGCAHPHFNGPQLEKSVKQLTRSLLSLESHDFYERIANRENKKGLQDSLEHELKSLEIKHNRNINAETELEHRNLMGRENPEVYRRLKARYQAERIWIEERVQAINEEMAQLNREAEAIGSLQQIKDRFFYRLDELTEAEWRELFIALNLCIHVVRHTEPGDAKLRLSSPEVTISYFRGNRDIEELQKRQPEPADVEVRIGLPLGESEEPVSNIVFTRPLSFTSPLSFEREALP